MTQVYVKHLKVKNFKSFSDIDIELKPFNVLIGANASGKSNFVQIFNFLRDIKMHGLKNALSLQGGVDYIKNIKNRSDKNLVIELELKITPRVEIMPYLGSENKIMCDSATWKLKLQMNEDATVQVITDEWNFKTEFFKDDDIECKEKISTNIIKMTVEDGMIRINGDWTDEEGPPFSELNNLILSKVMPNDISVIEYYGVINFVSRDISRFFDNIGVYDFDPKLAKKAISVKSKVELEEDGSNLAIILRSVLKDKEKQRMISNLVTDLLPFVRSLDTKNFIDKSVLFTLTETYFKDKSLPSFVISDGTTNIMALIVALYFQQHSLVMFEEAERNIHPSLIAQVVSMMKETSSTKQILITTHSPEMVRYAGLENILAIRRNNEGFSEIIHLAGKEEIKIFLKNEMEIEELYVQNILSE